MGEKVMYIGTTLDQISWGGNDDPRGVLETDKVYEVEASEIHSWHTKIKLVGVAGWFNSASFEKQTPPSPPDLPPKNLVHIALAQLDPKMLTSPDGKRVEVSLDAVCRLLAGECMPALRKP